MHLFVKSKKIIVNKLYTDEEDAAQLRNWFFCLLIIFKRNLYLVNTGNRLRWTVLHSSIYSPQDPQTQRFRSLRILENPSKQVKTKVEYLCACNWSLRQSLFFHGHVRVLDCFPECGYSITIRYFLKRGKIVHIHNDMVPGAFLNLFQVQTNTSAHCHTKSNKFHTNCLEELKPN